VTENNSPRSGRSKIAQQFTAGNTVRNYEKSVKRTTERFNRPLHGLTDFNICRVPTDESVGYFQSPALRAAFETLQRLDFTPHFA